VCANGAGFALRFKRQQAFYVEAIRISEQNVQLIQEWLARFATTGEPAWDTLHEEIVVHDHDVMDASEYRGHAGVRRWGEDWGAAWAEWSAEPEEFIDADDLVVAVFRVKATGRGSGVTVERQDAMVHKVRDGKIVGIDYYNSKQQALEAVGLAE
jgi:ketosteroid isomerase-like protein